MARPRVFTSGGQSSGRFGSPVSLVFFSVVPVTAATAVPIEEPIGVVEDAGDCVDVRGFLVTLAQVCHELQTLHGFPFSSSTTPGGRRVLPCLFSVAGAVVGTGVGFRVAGVLGASACRRRVRHVCHGIQTCTGLPKGSRIVPCGRPGWWVDMLLNGGKMKMKIRLVILLIEVVHFI